MIRWCGAIWGIGLSLGLPLLWADTIYLKNGKIYLGQVEELYEDRIVLAEVSGKLTLQRSSIRKIVYDAEDKNLLAMGNRYFKKDRFQEALSYYEKALKVNPQSNEVKEGILKVRGVLFRKREKQQSKQVNQRRNIDKWSETTRKHYVAPKESDRDPTGYVEQFLGLAVTCKDASFVVSDVVPESPAQKLHIFRGDTVYAVNGQKVGRMSIDALYGFLAGNRKGDLKLTIERKVVILRGSRSFYQGPWAWIDAKVRKIDKGFRVLSVKSNGRADLAGLRIHDIITNVEGEPSLFMSIESFQRKIKGEQGSRLVMRIIRQLKIKR